MIYPQRTLKPKLLLSGAVMFTRHTIWPSILLVPPSLGLMWLATQMIRQDGECGLLGWIVLAGSIPLVIESARWCFLRETIIHDPKQGMWTYHFRGLLSSTQKSYQHDEAHLLLKHTLVWGEYFESTEWICQICLPHGTMILSSRACGILGNPGKHYNKILCYTKNVANMLGIPCFEENLHGLPTKRLN